jgi:hypothetical protein
VWVRARLCKLQKGCTRLAAASDKVYQLLAHGRWFSSGILPSSTTKTVRHDIAEILLKVALNTKIKSNLFITCKSKTKNIKRNICLLKKLTSHTGPPREILQGGTRLLWDPEDRLRHLSKLRILSERTVNICYIM